MKSRNRFIGILGSIGLCILILDSKTAITGGQEGIRLCLQTVIPALFPFFIISGLVCQSFLGESITFLRPLGALCGIPKGSESLLLLSYLGGYPVGAKNIANAVQYGSISRDDAKRMLGFCNNAGPAFLFGMAASLFESKWAPWVLWFIHIISSILVGCILPGKTNSICKLAKPQNTDKIQNVKRAVYTMANVCAWVILFRVFLSFTRKWVFFFLPVEFCVWITGLAELTNGIIGLQTITNDGLRFILCAGLLGFGGLCVAMQTISILESIGTGYYFPGKVMQGCISLILAYFMQNALFNCSQVFLIPIYWLILPLLGILVSVLFLYPRKNNSRNLSQTYV